MSTTLIHNIRKPGRNTADIWILINNDIIEDVGYSDTTHPNADHIVDGEGALVLPGVIDCHVHFREPGMTEKADIATESRAAVAGGVTSYLEMPNTNPPTTTIERWEEKMQLAEEKSVANYAFFIGATNDNLDQLLKADYTRIPGVKLFMGSSTGNMLVDDDDSISKIFREVNAIVAVHAEDQHIIAENIKKYKAKYGDGPVPLKLHSVIRSSEACYKCTERAVKLARKYNRRLHICHLTTKAELSLLEYGNPSDRKPLACKKERGLNDKLITSEVSPHHLMWCDEDYDQCGARIKMNPAVKSAADRKALREALEDHLIDMVATDHAPHLLSQKQGDALTAVSGAPLVQYSLPWMLSNFEASDVVYAMCHAPAEIYGIEKRGYIEPGYYADITLVKETEPYTVSDSDAISRCRWTPLAGEKLSYKVLQTWVNGRLVYADGKILDEHAAMPLRFSRTTSASK